MGIKKCKHKFANLKICNLKIQKKNLFRNSFLLIHYIYIPPFMLLNLHYTHMIKYVTHKSQDWF